MRTYTAAQFAQRSMFARLMPCADCFVSWLRDSSRPKAGKHYAMMAEVRAQPLCRLVTQPPRQHFGSMLAACFVAKHFFCGQTRNRSKPNFKRPPRWTSDVHACFLTSPNLDSSHANLEYF